VIRCPLAAGIILHHASSIELLTIAESSSDGTHGTGGGCGFGVPPSMISDFCAFGGVIDQSSEILCSSGHRLSATLHRAFELGSLRIRPSCVPSVRLRDFLHHVLKSSSEIADAIVSSSVPALTLATIRWALASGRDDVASSARAASPSLGSERSNRVESLRRYR